MKPRNIKIETVLNGWIVKVGCLTVVFDNLEDMMQEIRAYMKEPEKREYEFLAKSVYKTHGGLIIGDVDVTPLSHTPLDPPTSSPNYGFSPITGSVRPDTLNDEE